MSISVVEVAGFETQPQSSRNALGAGAPLVSVDSFAFLRLRRRPTGATVGSLTPGLYKAAAPTPSNRQYENPDTHKGHPDFHVEVAGFEPAAFWSRTKRATKLRYTSKLEPMRGLEPLTC